jgi:hypothetical protein
MHESLMWHALVDSCVRVADILYWVIFIQAINPLLLRQFRPEIALHRPFAFHLVVDVILAEWTRFPNRWHMGDSPIIRESLSLRRRAPIETVLAIAEGNAHGMTFDRLCTLDGQPRTPLQLALDITECSMIKNDGRSFIK